MRQTHYLETRSTQDWLSFHCQEDQIVLIGISSKSNGIDFTQVDDFKNLIEADLEIFTQSKRYKDNREAEIYGMIENGATISKGESYKQFALVLAELNAKEN